MQHGGAMYIQYDQNIRCAAAEQVGAGDAEKVGKWEAIMKPHNDVDTYGGTKPT